ncbi:MAG TPA: glycosyltransferase family 87 protein [Candidatus Limnocylindrales bacterium]|nr:glycosyltransferase family 87 protein [Candidatus Limnocylindrales bacterium]
MRHWVGIRRLYEPRFQSLIITGLLAVMVAYYAVFSVVNWVTLDAAALRFDFVNYFGGAQAAAHGSDIYAEFKRSWGTQAWTVAYIYPPFFALVLAPLTPLGLVAAGRIWLIAIQGAFIASLWLLLRIHPELSPIQRRLFLLAALAFMPVYVNVKFQQVATVWLLLLTAALWGALRRRGVLAGLFLALAASLKVIPIFCIPLFVRLRRTSIAVAAAGLLIAITTVTVVASPGSWQFFTVVLPRIGLGNANWDNASIDGLVSRFVELNPAAFGSATVTVGKLAVALAVLAVLGVTLWQSGQGGAESWQLRLSMAATVTALLMVSSVTWQHHLVIVLLPLACAMAWISARRPGARYAWWALTGYVLCWIDRRSFPLPADHTVHSLATTVGVLLGTSVKLVGLAVLWALLLTMMRLEARRVRQPRHDAQGSARPAAA